LSAADAQAGDLRGLDYAHLNETPTSEHAYLSTACAHGECGSCRRTCKFCGTSCLHGCHPHTGEQPASPVDQARDIALELLDATRAAGIDLYAVAPDLAARLDEDPALFWARGEVQPPGEWQGTPEQKPAAYDRDAHALYLTLGAPIQPGGVVRTVSMDAMVNADLDAEGRVLGVEILNPWPAGGQTEVPAEKSLLRWHWGNDRRECSDCGAEVYAFEEGLICSGCDRQADE
jgi:uncharacterized protein YuzE